MTITIVFYNNDHVLVYLYCFQWIFDIEKYFLQGCKSALRAEEGDDRLYLEIAKVGGVMSLFSCCGVQKRTRFSKAEGCKLFYW
jgi:hypothetical protein